MHYRVSLLCHRARRVSLRGQGESGWTAAPVGEGVRGRREGEEEGAGMLAPLLMDACELDEDGVVQTRANVCAGVRAGCGDLRRRA